MGFYIPANGGNFMYAHIKNKEASAKFTGTPGSIGINDVGNPFLLLANASGKAQATQKKQKQDEYKKARAELKAKYGYEPYRWLGYADGANERKIRKVIKEVADAFPNISPAQLYTVAIGEGLNLWIQDNYTADASDVQIGNPISGYGYLGTDDFASDRKRFVSGGHLRKDFDEGDEFTEYETENEQGRTVKTADFTSLKYGLEALAATLEHRRSLVKKAVGNKKLDDDNWFFWTYAFFVDGEGDGKKHIKQAQADYTKSTRTQIKYKALRRTATVRYVEQFIDFSN